MKINNGRLISVNNGIISSEPVQTKSLEQQKQTEKAVELPNIAPNYMTNISFRGECLDWDAINQYTQKMGDRIYSKRNVEAMSKAHGKSNGITAGRGIPDVWTDRIKDIENFDKDAFIIDFSKAFAKERDFANVDRLQKELSILFKKHGILDADTPFSVRYIGHGFQGWAYKIQIGDDENSGIVTKLFKRNSNYFQNHGNYTEQNLAEYVKRYAGDESEFTKYYFGDTKIGLMVVDYISPTQRPTKKLDMTDIGIGYDDDAPKNRINGIICDFGGIITVTNLMGNKSAQEVHKAIKYEKSVDEKIRMFNEILAENDGSDAFKDKAIGLVHSIKHMPESMQPELYKKCYELGSHRVNIALIQNIKNMKKFDDLKSLIEKLVDNAEDVKEQETIAKEIASIPDEPRHRFFERHSDTKVSAIIKYLARNINRYRNDRPKAELEAKNNIDITGLPVETVAKKTFASTRKRVELRPQVTVVEIKEDNRSFIQKLFDSVKNLVSKKEEKAPEPVEVQPQFEEQPIDEFEEMVNGVAIRERIFDKFLDNSDTYAGISLLSKGMEYMPKARYDEYFERFYAKKDPIINITLARSLELFKFDSKLQEKWVNKLMNCSDVRVLASLCESLEFVNKDIRKPMLEKLLPVKDRVAKEFLAKNITLVPDYKNHPEWVEAILDGADNMIRGSLANTINNMSDDYTAKIWTKIVLKGADATIKGMLTKQ